MYKICVNQLFMLSVQLPVNSRLLIVKFWGSQKLYMEFQLWWVVLLTPALFKDQLYTQISNHFFLSNLSLQCGTQTNGPEIKNCILC